MIPDGLPEPAPKHILVVEDEASIRIGLGDRLRDAGFHVVEAANADEAWRYLRSNAPIDLIFSDINMPGSMDGIELARLVIQGNDTIPIILSSGTGRTWSASRLGRFLPKPYRYEHAVAMVLDMLGIDLLGGV